MRVDCEVVSQTLTRNSVADAASARVIGEGALIRPAEAQALYDLAKATEAATAGPCTAPFRLDQVRRFPAAQREAISKRFLAHTHLSQLDRPQTLVAAHEIAGATNALALLGSAMNLMGYVLRDAAVLRVLLRTLAPRDFVFHRAAVVALGLLGVALSPDEGIVSAADPADIEAYVLGAALVDGPSGVRAANAAYRRATSAVARDAADAALARVEAGDLLGVIG
jgi:hypothetical protein